VTGEAEDRRPEFCSVILDLLPTANDDLRWASDAARTAALRPFIQQILALDPQNDISRMCRLLDYLYLMHVRNYYLSLETKAAKRKAELLRTMPPVIDIQSCSDFMYFLQANDLHIPTRNWGFMTGVTQAVHFVDAREFTLTMLLMLLLRDIVGWQSENPNLGTCGDFWAEVFRTVCGGA
jgi:hypothetical protein